MNTIGPILAASGKLALGYAERLLKDVRADQFARLASPGGVVVQSNHPAFVFGHLSLYPPRVLELLGRPVAEVAVPPSWEGLFKAGCECRDDATGTIYPPMQQVTDQFFKGYKIAVEMLAAAEDAILLKENPTEGRMKELFPTIGAAMGFYVGGHVQMHLGQISAWRRAMGMAAAG